MYCMFGTTLGMEGTEQRTGLCPHEITGWLRVNQIKKKKINLSLSSFRSLRAYYAPGTGDTITDKDTVQALRSLHSSGRST